MGAKIGLGGKMDNRVKKRMGKELSKMKEGDQRIKEKKGEEGRTIW